MALSETARKNKAIYMQAWRKQNRKHIQNYQKRWRSENPDKCDDIQERYWSKKSNVTSPGLDK